MINVLIRKKGDRDSLQLYYVDPATKKEVSRSARTADEKQALKNAARWEDELKRFRGSGGDGWDYFRQRFEFERLNGLAWNSCEAYSTALNSFRNYWKGTRLSEVTASVLSHYQASLAKAGYPATTIASYLRHLMTAFRWAHKMGIIATVPAVFMPKQPKDVSRGRALTTNEWKAFIAACPDPQWVRFAEMMVLAGFRLEEAFIASWDDDRIRVEPEAKPFPRIWFRADSHKARRDMYVPMTPDFQAWLRRIPASQRTGAVCPLECDSRNRAGLPFTDANGVGKVMSKIGREAGIVTGRKRGLPTFAGSHDLRRTFGTNWAAKVKPLTLQRLMRHVDFSTTLKYYVNLSLEDIANDVWSAVPSTVPNGDQIRWLTEWVRSDFREEFEG